MLRKYLLLTVCVISLKTTLMSQEFAKVIIKGFKEFNKETNAFKDWQWTINNVSFNVNPDTNFVPLNNAGFDTIIFFESSRKKYVLAKLTKKHLYIISYNPCCNYFHISDMNGNSKYKPKLDSTDDDELIENCRVRFKIINYSGNDSIAGIFGDIYGGFSSGVLLKKNTFSKYQQHFRTGYSGYIYHIAIGKVKRMEGDDYYEKEKDMDFFILENENKNTYAVKNTLADISYRFFKDEKLSVIYDFKTDRLNIKVD